MRLLGPLGGNHACPGPDDVRPEVISGRNLAAFV